MAHRFGIAWRVPAVLLLIAGPATHGAYGQGLAVSAQQFYNSAIGNPNLNQEAGEGWAWHAAFSMDHFARAYQAVGDTSWLDYGVQYYEFVIDKMRVAPDGYQGWIGPHIGNDQRWADVHIGDAILINPMLKFAQIVQADPGLQAQYGVKAQQYIELAQVHLIEKWHTRGTWYEDGRYGAYHSWNQYLEPNDFSQWHTSPSSTASLGLPHNKNQAMGIAALRLYQLTGEQEYRQKAEMIFSTTKSRMQIYNDTAVWNYWEPMAPWDINLNTQQTSHWVGVHPTTGYQRSEVAEIVEAFHAGIVFDAQDIQRITNTNLEVMWNGSLEDPKYLNSNAHILPGGTTNSGTLWSALADFDQTIRDLRRFGTTNRDLIDQAYFQNVTLASQPGFERKHAGEDDVTVFAFPSEGNSRFLHMALAMPSMMTAGDPSMIFGVRSKASGLLDIAIYDADGIEQLLLLSSADITGGSSGRYLLWDGLNLLGEPLVPGNYRVRWTLSGDGYREALITIVPEPGTMAGLGAASLLLLRVGRSRRR
jgi:hypothetical protein